MFISFVPVTSGFFQMRNTIHIGDDSDGEKDLYVFGAFDDLSGSKLYYKNLLIFGLIFLFAIVPLILSYIYNYLKMKKF